ncbi:pilus assembly protein N-terminal domain-containing protein [Methyloligella sp. 2.7D]|uniref:pilus assembly protein N-terminal domain-containing protein n=1 Tax=unclassified Methyloligella TaxID=2625955 RepID=UPI00157D17C5|nr:pilus assembly protein N-terminal domain-containing protein [Methyloligella sp. GL2]QKP78591.1 pilus assembly protein N-terminal domain-containing protein [Methyloligella sp. GL2]
MLTGSKFHGATVAGRWVQAFSAALIAAGLLVAQAATAQQRPTNVIDVNLDQAKLVKLERPAAEIIVGNPSIADVSVQNAGLLVVTGKSFGRTNMIVIDGAGNELLNTALSVSDPGFGMVTLHKGTEPGQTVYCAPRCTTPLAIGDDPSYFKEIESQISAKQGLAQQSVGSSGQR